MQFYNFKNSILILVLTLLCCGSKKEEKVFFADKKTETSLLQTSKSTIVGANDTEAYIPYLKGKTVGIVANQTSVIQKSKIQNSKFEVRSGKYEVGSEKLGIEFTHLVDSLLKLDIDIKKVFSPEHGFRGTADAGEVIKDGVDIKSGLPIVSLYGKNKKPSQEQLEGFDVVILDIQDVGARFYTYISTLHYVMEACAEAEIPLLILDRPNPNGHYIDGPILESEHKSFVGMHPVPVVHGMTIGEYAQMINGEAWLNGGIQCELKIIPVKNYNHQTEYKLPIPPSPNLPNAKSINLYPSLCFFEGTPISVGRGTDKQFQVIGTPEYNLKRYNYFFTPQANEGAKYPKHKGKECFGYNLSKTNRLNQLELKWLIEFYKSHKQYAKDTEFFKSFFTKLSGTEQLKQQIEQGLSVEEIRKSWAGGLENYRLIREKYLLYD